MTPAHSLSGRTVRSALGTALVVLTAGLLMGINYEWVALLVAQETGEGGDSGLGGQDCKGAPCEFYLHVDCEGRISRMSGVAADGSGVVIDFRLEQ